jgi:hypothetical protein
MADSEVAVECMLRGIGNLAVDKEDLLVNLVELRESASCTEAEGKPANMRI